MKRFIVAFSLLALILTVLCVFSESSEAAVQTISVSNAREFIEALGSNRVIEMDYTGDYNLSEWEFSDDLKLPAGVRWSGVFDGAELVVNGVKNLKISGGGPEGAKAYITVNPRYAFVLNFENCSDVVLEDISAEHSEGGYCAGGVFSFTDSSRITVANVRMSGCGTEGLTLSNVSGMKVTDSSIVDCTYFIMTVTGGENIAFDDCMFMDNREFTLVNVSGTRNISFSNCYFNDNQGQMFDVNGTNVSVSNSSFNRNRTGSPIQRSSNVKFTNCEFN